MRFSLFLVSCCLCLAWNLTPAHATTYVVFRYDDLAADLPGLRESNTERRAIWEAEQAVDQMFEKAGLPYVAAVVPNGNPAYLLRSAGKEMVPLSVDAEKVALIKRSMNAGRMQVALHGHEHTNHRPAKARASEFNRSLDEQYHDLVAGRKILLETLGCDRITTFIPPFFGWNENTPPALVKSGFEIISADRYQTGDTKTGIINIPFTAQLWDMEALLAQDRLPDNSFVVVIYHPPQIAKISGHENRFVGLTRFENLLTTLALRPEVKIVSFDGLQNMHKELTATRYMASVRITKLRSLWARVIPTAYLPGIAKDGIYLEESEYTKTYRLWMGITLFAALIILLAGFFVGRLICAKLPRFLNLIFTGGTLLGLAVSIWLLLELNRRGFHANFIRTFPIVILSGVLLGAIRQQFVRSKQPTPAGTNLPP